ncbi:hypothetical protein ABV23_RS00560 [Escherichia coli]|nr:hypothetical protein [Escherichia coli]
MFKKIAVISCVLLAVGCTAPKSSIQANDPKPTYSEMGDKICTVNPYFVIDNRPQFTDPRSIPLTEHGDHFSVVIGDFFTESPVLKAYPNRKFLSAYRDAENERVFYARERVNGKLVYNVEVIGHGTVGIIVYNCK